MNSEGHGADLTPRGPPSDDGPPRLSPEQARLLPFYHDLRNEIVEPDKVVVSTQYFWTKWAPRLGPTLTALVVCLRRHCYYNRATQERRDWCFPEQATLAREIGVETTKTVRAALGHPLADLFVRREARYVYDPGRGKKIRTSDMYFVAMDDPLIPEDETLLAQRAADRILAEGRGSELTLNSAAPRRPKAQIDRQVRRPSTSQNGLQVVSPGGQLTRQDSAAFSTPELVHEESTNTTKYGTGDLARVVVALADANGYAPTPAQIERLAALSRQFDAAARRDDPAASGTAWVCAAIQEAVESGSHFVAPRRIARICERWAVEGGPGKADGRRPPRAGATTSERDGPEDLNGGLIVAERPAEDEEEELSEGEMSDKIGETEPALLRNPRLAPPSFPELGLPGRAVWQAVCDEARRRVTAPGDFALLVGSRLIGRETHVLIIGVPGRSAAQRAQRRLAGTLGDVTAVVLGRSFDVQFVSLAEWGATADKLDESLENRTSPDELAARDDRTV